MSLSLRPKLNYVIYYTIRYSDIYIYELQILLQESYKVPSVHNKSAKARHYLVGCLAQNQFRVDHP